MPRYFVENTHEAIIPMETYRAVREEQKRRRELGVFANPAIPTTCFTGRIKCGNCGKSYRRNGKRQRKEPGEVYYIWVCQTYDRKGKAACPSKAVPELTLKKICAETLDTREFDGEMFLKEIEKIIVTGGDRLDFYFYGGRVVEKRWTPSEKKDCWTNEYRKQASEYRRRNPPKRRGITCLTSKIRCGMCGANFHRQARTDAEGKRRARWFCPQHRKDAKLCQMARTADEDVIKSLAAKALGTDGFDEKAFRERASRITVTGAGALTVELKNGDSKKYTFSTKKKGTPWTEERKAKMSATMKKVRSEKHWSGKRK